MIKIQKDKILYNDLAFDSNNNRIIEDKNLKNYLSEYVQIDKGVTFERIFDLIILDKEFYSIVFASVLRFFKIEHFIDEYKMEDNDENPEFMDYLIVSKIFDNLYYEKKENGLTEIQFYNSFGGIKENYTDEIFTEPRKMGCGVSFIPLNNLKKYEIKIDNSLIIRSFNINLKTKNKDYELLKGEIELTLFDLFDAILQEISFHGSPEMRNEQRDKLKKYANIDYDLQETYKLLVDDNGNILFENNNTGEIISLDDNKN